MENSMKQLVSSSTHLKLSFQDRLNKLKRVTLKKYKKHILLLGGAFGVINLALSLFSIYTLISFVIVMTCMLGFLRINWLDVKSKGLITYFPSKAQKVLLHRSLFDIFCDLWFIPEITLYAKAFLLPFFTKIEPSEAINQFKDLSRPTRKAILTKGVVNIFPNFLKSAILPREEKQANDESDTSSEVQSMGSSQQERSVEDGRQVRERPEKVQGSNQGLMENSDKTTSLDSHQYEKEHHIPHDTRSHGSTDDDRLVNHNLSLDQQLELKKTLPSFEDINPIQSHLDFIGGLKGIEALKNQSHLHGGFRTRNRKIEQNTPQTPTRGNISNDSSSVQKKKKAQLSSAWDKLEVFTKKARENFIKQKKAIPSRLEFKGHLQTVYNMVKLMSVEGLMEKLEGKKLAGVFLLSSLALLVQLSVSKRARVWGFYTLKLLIYLMGVTLSTGSLALLAMKIKTAHNQKKENQLKKEEETKREVLSDFSSGDEEDEV